MGIERENTRRRVAEVRVKLQPEMAARLDEIAKRRGVPSATLAALVIGEYVERYDQHQRYQQMAVVESARLMVKDFMPQMEKALDQMSPEFALKMFSYLGTGEDSAQGRGEK